MSSLLRSLLFFATFSLCTAAIAASEEMTLNFVGADIQSAVKALGEVTGRNFVIDPRVKGNINIVSGKPVSRELAYEVLVSALRLQGFAVVESGNATKILPEADARQQAGPLRRQGKVGGGDQIMTQVFHLRYETAAQLANALKPLVGPNQSITANPASNTLVVTDAADNLQRIERIIASIDVPHGDDPQIVPLRHASAVDVAASLQKLFPAAQGGNNLIVTADPRANRVILRSDNAGLLARAGTLIAGMDKPESGFGNIHVVYLKNAEAAKVAQTLRAILGSDTGANGGGNALSATAPLSGGAGGSGATSLGATTPAAVATPTSVGNPGSSALMPGSMIQADVASNALIVTAPDSVFNNLQNVIAMLDRRRAQVHIEALIVELSAEKAAEFGFQWQAVGKGSTVGGTNFGNATQNILSLSSNISKAGVGLNLGLASGNSLNVLARMLETEAHGNILSTPNIMTLDNEEAKIVIGQNLPFVTGSYSTSNTNATTPFQTYERRDVGLTLKVRPQITEGGVVRVQIYQEVSSVQSGTESSTAGPTTNKRSLESSVLVDDGATIVLGGLIKDDLSVDEEKVPVLGDLPFIRNLFRYQNRSRKKTNLMVFLRPRIIRDGLDYQGITDDRYSLLLNEQKRQEQVIPSNAWGDNAVPRLEERSAKP
ncbi:type II secretion system secretin GspD [Azonexus sp. IMCC34839]|uniref:type II secretion system secretin GspD n=1 Tax=Azonexus sp. IMCC34839 TaxID=3133695 RepID=UPI003999856E